MKIIGVIALFLAVVSAQEEQKNVRLLPADILRDFPGFCFASTSCRVYQVGETWELKPFCGKATCTQNGPLLIERVEDCGRVPINRNATGHPLCQPILTSDAAKDEPFPKCCPTGWDCGAGVEPIFEEEGQQPGPPQGLPGPLRPNNQNSPVQTN